MNASVLPGTGTVARSKSTILVLEHTDDRESAAGVLDVVQGAADEGASGRELAHRLAQHITGSAPKKLPGFAVIADDPGGIAFVVSGDMAVVAKGPNDEVREFSGLNSLTSLDGYITDATSIRIHSASAPAESGVLPGDLIEGVVPGGGVVVVIAESDAESGPIEEDQPPARDDSDDSGEPALSSAQLAADETEGEPGPQAPFETIDLSDFDLSDLEPLEIVTVAPGEEPSPAAGDDRATSVDLIPGIRCSRGHFNHPDARFCAHCGIGMVHLTQKIVYDARPPLGIVVFTDGSTFMIDSPYVIGREPSMDPLVRTGEARSIELDDDGLISRAHMTLEIDGWEIYVVDQSSNGTEMLLGGNWKRLISNEKNRLEPGAEVRFGEYQFSFDSHHRAAKLTP